MRRLVAVLVVTLGFVIPAFESNAHAITTTYRVFQFNACGWSDLCSGGSRGGFAVSWAISESLRNDGLIRIATLNEICKHQSDAILNDLAAHGHLWYGIHDRTQHLPASGTKAACDFGNAILWRGSPTPAEVGSPYVFELYTEAGRPSGPHHIMCLQLNTPKPLTEVCVTHLQCCQEAWQKETRNVQAIQINNIMYSMTYAEGGVGTDAVVLGGDFNAVPLNTSALESDPMDWIYRAHYAFDSRGHLSEACDRDFRQGPATLASLKYDYVFFTTPPYLNVIPPAVGCTTGYSPHSDHRTLRGNFN